MNNMWCQEPSILIRLILGAFSVKGKIDLFLSRNLDTNLNIEISEFR